MTCDFIRPEISPIYCWDLRFVGSSILLRICLILRKDLEELLLSLRPYNLSCRQFRCEIESICWERARRGALPLTDATIRPRFTPSGSHRTITIVCVDRTSFNLSITFMVGTIPFHQLAGSLSSNFFIQNRREFRKRLSWSALYVRRFLYYILNNRRRQMVYPAPSGCP